MKLVCTKENLGLALSHLERVTGRHTTLPILSNYLLETEKGRLKISATNLEIGIISYVGAKIEQEGKLTVPAKLLGNFIHNLPQGEVLELQTGQSTLGIKSGAYEAKIKATDGKDFPIIPEFKKDYFFSLPAQELKRSFARLLFCVSTNESRVELTGVHFSFFENEVHLAATDSFRLGEEIIPLKDPEAGYREFIGENPTLILPHQTLQEIMRLVGEDTAEVRMALEENQVFFEIDGNTLVSRLINGKYPPYKDIIPKSFALVTVFEKESLVRALKIASTFSSYNVSEITLAFDPAKNECVLTSQSPEIGENKTVLPVEWQSGETTLRIVFNPRYVLDGLGALSGEKVQFSANNEATPVVFRGVHDKEAEKNYLYIVMPIRK